MTLKAIKVNSMGYDIVNDKNERVGYAKKIGYEKYRLSDDDGVIGKFKSVEACVDRLLK